MANNLLVINCDIRETRVALIENGVIAELHIERASQDRCLGNVVFGKVTRVLPGMQAAFIDVGLDKAAFLHVEDLIRPNDFDAYLTGKKKGDRGEDEQVPGEDAAPRASAAASADDAVEGDDDDAGDDGEDDEGDGASVAEGPREAPKDAEAGSVKAEAQATEGRAAGAKKKRRRRRSTAAEPTRDAKKRPGGDGTPGRIDKNTPIKDVVKEGEQVVVQISKAPIGTKGARVTSHVSLPGRYVVYMPTLDYIGVSKRIGNEKERRRLREAIETMKPPHGGLIVRTLAEGLTKKQLKADIGYLVRLWGEISGKREGAKAPAVLYEELDIVLRAARDLFHDDVERIVIDDKAQYERLVRFVEMFLPERVKDIEFYSGEEPIFDEYGLEDEITRALSRRVPLPSGGYLIIDETEALTAIDVNTGRFVGKGSKDHEETILKTNLEAVDEIAYQLRFRNLGGLIVLDLIDMERAENRETVRKRLDVLLQKDKAKTSLNRISELGLIEMTRKRTRESLGRAIHENCPYCDGTGHTLSKETIVYEILRALRRERSSLPGYTVLVNAHPDVCAHFKMYEREALKEAERRYMRRIDLVPQKGYHIEQFDLVGK